MRVLISGASGLKVRADVGEMTTLFPQTQFVMSRLMLSILLLAAKAA